MSADKKPKGELVDGGRDPLMHEIAPGEKMARLTISPERAVVRCLVLRCEFIAVSTGASRRVMEREVKGDYRAHRRLKHREYLGPTQFEYALGEGWVEYGTGSTATSGATAGKANPD